MAFTSFSFLLSAAIILILYYAVPGRVQWLLLLGASCLFYLRWGTENLTFLLLTVLTAYAATRLMDRNHAFLARLSREERKAKKAATVRKNRLLLILCLIMNFGMLLVCKVRFLDGVLLPLGISFYLFQTMGYVIDVYRGSAKAEKNVLKLALFISFFPQLIQGPISKFGQLAPQLIQPHPFDSKQLFFGLQRMLWGYFKKLVIADRIAAAVVALKAPEYTGAAFLLLTVFYAVQIYADFTGGIDTALGLSQCFGITLPENFTRPFFSKSIAEYWRRWHITLGEWMKDYIFYPVSVSAPMRKLSKAARARWGNWGKRIPVYIASGVTWFVTGVWHGLTPNFILWGMLNCLVIVVSGELTPLYTRFHSRFRLKERKWYNGFEMLRTFWLMNLIRICDLFPNTGDYFGRIGSLVTDFQFHILWDGTLMNLGLTGLDYTVIGFGTAGMLAVSLIQACRGSVRELLWRRNAVLRWSILFVLFLTVLLMGSYGVGYDASQFIYNQF